MTMPRPDDLGRASDGNVERLWLNDGSCIPTGSVPPRSTSGATISSSPAVPVVATAHGRGGVGPGLPPLAGPSIPLNRAAGVSP